MDTPLMLDGGDQTWEQTAAVCWWAAHNAWHAANMGLLLQQGGGEDGGTSIIDLMWQVFTTLDGIMAALVQVQIGALALQPIWGNWILDALIPPIRNWLEPWFFQFISAPINLLGNFLQAGFQDIAMIGTAIQALPTGLFYVINSAIANAIPTLLSILLESSNGIFPGLGDLIQIFLTLFPGFLSGLTNMPTTIGLGLANLVTSLINAPGAFASIILQPLVSIANALNIGSVNWQDLIITSILTVLAVAGTRIIEVIASMIPGAVNFITEIIQMFLPAGLQLVAGMFSGISSLPSAQTDLITAIAGTNLALDPGRALMTVIAAYGVALAAGTGAHLVSTALDAIPTLDWVGAPQLAGLIGSIAGFEPLSHALYGTIITDTVTIPLHYYYNRQFRPKLPGANQIMSLARKHAIDHEEFLQEMSYEGLPDEWIERLWQFDWTEPSPMWLLRMATNGIPAIGDPGDRRDWLDQWIPNWRTDNTSWVRMKLMLAGFEEADIGIMITALMQRAIAATTSQLKTAVRAMVREGFWSEGDASGALSPLGILPEEIHNLYIAEDLDYQRAFMVDQVNYYVAEFRKDAISESDLGIALSTIIIRPDRVNQIVAAERVRKLPAPKKIIPIADDPLVTKIRTQAINSWLKAYRSWDIEIEDLRQGILLITEDSALTDQMIATELLHYRGVRPESKPIKEDPIAAASRRNAINTWISAYRLNTINAQELDLYLAPLIPDPDIRSSIEQLEQLRYVAPSNVAPPTAEPTEVSAVRKEYINAHISMFNKRQITAPDLFAFLIADGLSQDLAGATVLTQAYKRLKVPDLSSPYYNQTYMQDLIDAGLNTWTSQYISGDISYDQLLSNLSAIVTDPAMVTYLADQAEIQRFSGSLG